MPGLLTDCLVTATESGFEQDWARQRRTAEDTVSYTHLTLPTKRIV